ncbi:MAG: hypothetical protein KBA75_08290 [Alphaproteobacteria bacterium]|nr:hypothetical protein [Alphaproteobacteria bacterium]
MQSQNGSFGAAAREVSVSRVSRLTRLATASALAAVTLFGASGCAVLVNDHGNNGTVMSTWEVGLGMNGKTGDKILDATKNTPIIGDVARNVLGNRMYVDEQGRSIFEYKLASPYTTFCGWQKTDCPNIPPPSNSGIYTRQAPDVVNIVGPEGAQMVRLVPKDPSKDTLITFQYPNGAYASPTVEVNGKPYTMSCPDGQVGALRQSHVPNDLRNAATCIPVSKLQRGGPTP